MATGAITNRNAPVPRRSLGHDLNAFTEWIIAVDLHLQPHWQHALGQHVEIRLDGITIRSGVVEAVMPDDSILWISADGLNGREMVERADGKEVYARYSWDIAPPHSPRDHKRL